jgi:hypothetical protein
MRLHGKGSTPSFTWDRITRPLSDPWSSVRLPMVQVAAEKSGGNGSLVLPALADSKDPNTGPGGGGATTTGNGKPPRTPFDTVSTPLDPFDRRERGFAGPGAWGWVDCGFWICSGTDMR